MMATNRGKTSHRFDQLKNDRIPCFDKNLRLYFARLQTHVWIYDIVSATFAWGNQRAIDILGKKDLDDLVQSDLSSEVSKDYIKYISKIVVENEVAILPWTFYPDGKDPFEVTCRFSTIFYEGRACLLNEEVHQIDQQLESKLVNTAFQFCPMMLSLLAMDGKLLIQNSKALAYYKEQPTDRNKESWLQYLLGDEMYDKAMTAIAHGEIFHSNVGVAKASQPNCWHRITLSRQKHPINGEDILLLSQFDITKAKRMEDHVREMENRDQQKNSILNGVNGDLQAPLIGIIGLCQNLADIPEVTSNRAAIETVETIYKMGNELLVLMKNLLTLSNLNGSAVEFHQDYVNLYWLVEDVCADVFRCPGVVVDSTKRLDKVKIVNNVPHDLPELLGDYGHLREAIGCLCRNALKFTKQGRIVISAKLADEGRYLVLSVEDTGCGICEEELWSIRKVLELERYHYIKQRSGTGIGLNIVKEVVKLHNGEISVESTLGAGTKFTCAFPFQTSPASGETTAQSLFTSEKNKSIQHISESCVHKDGYLLRELKNEVNRLRKENEELKRQGQCTSSSLLVGDMICPLCKCKVEAKRSGDLGLALSQHVTVCAMSIVRKSQQTIKALTLRCQELALIGT